MVTAADSLSMQVNLFVSGRKLRDLDTFSKSDPMCLLFEKRNGRWNKVGATEQVNDSLNPDLRTSFTVPYYFEKVQLLKFVMIDGDGHGEYDTIGDVEVTIGNLMGAQAQMWTGNLTYKTSDNRGKLIVRTEAI